MRLRKRLSAAILAIVMIVSSVQMPGGMAYAAQKTDSRMESGSQTSILNVGETEGTEEIKLREQNDDDGQNADANAADESGSQNGDVDTVDGSGGQNADVDTADGSSQNGDADAVDGGSQNGDGSADSAGGSGQTGDDTPAGGGSQNGDADAADGSGQNGDADAADGNGQNGDTDAAGGNGQNGDADAADGDQNGDADAVSGNDLEEAVPDLEKKEETDADIDTEEMIEEKISGVYQFGGAPEQPAGGRRVAGAGTPDLSITAYDGSDLEEWLYQEFLQRKTEFELSGQKISKNDKAVLKNLIVSVLNEHPDLYFVKNGSMYWYDDASEVWKLRFSYYGEEDYDDEAFKNNTAAALACVEDGMSDLQKAVALHDYLCVNVEYDKEYLEDGKVHEDALTAYGALVNHIAVCQGYALAYKYLLNQSGIECHMVTSKSMNHAWNMVKLDGKYYQVDVTWDDPTWDMVGRAVHTYMFCSDDNFAKHSDWAVTVGASVVDYTATDTTYDNAFWKNSRAPLVIKGNDCYYVSEGGSIRKADFADITAEGTQLVENVGSWPAWGGGGMWPGAFSGLFMIDGRLYYNDKDCIYSVQEDGTGRRTEFSADTSEGYIYGSAYRQGKVYYALHQTPNLTAKEVVLEAELTGADNPDDPDDPNNPDEPEAEIPPHETAEGWNIPNLDWQFNAYYGSIGWRKLSTNPSDFNRPIVLMFFDRTWPWPETNGNVTMQNVIPEDSYIPGVSAYAIDIRSGTNEELAEFGKTYNLDSYMLGIGINDINENVNVESIYRSKMYTAYENAVKDKKLLNPVDKGWPVIFYIDIDNKIQYASHGDATLEEVDDNLHKYCNYSLYTIEYEMNGGVNGKNPSYYVEGDEVILENPEYRDGYRFGGWYLDQGLTKKITKIPVGTKADITLYAKWSVVEGPFNLENPAFDKLWVMNKEYKDGDYGEDISYEAGSTAEGRPKLLMFSNSSNIDNAYAGINNIIRTQPEHDLQGVDIYIMSTENNTYNYESMSAYIKKARLDWNPENARWNDILYCYIDAQNRFQYACVGQEKWSWNENENTDIVNKILSNLSEYCRYPDENAEYYTITYEMNGGPENFDNPHKYNSGMKKNLPLQAARDWTDSATGKTYRFAGWYADAELTQRITEIEVDSGRDLTIYARWVAEVCNVSNLDFEWTGIDGGKVSSHADGKAKVLLFGNFRCARSEAAIKSYAYKSEWFKNADICYISLHDGPEDPSLSDADYVRGLKEQCGDDIIFTEGGVAWSWQASDYEYAGNYSKHPMSGWPDAVFIAPDDTIRCVEDGYWSFIDYSSVARHNIKILQDYCDYEIFWVNYQLNGGINHSENPDSYLPGGETMALKNPAKLGYRFEGWYSDPQYTKPVTEIDPETMAKDITLYAKWTEGPASSENLTQEYTALDDTKIASTASGKPKVLIFYWGGEKGPETGCVETIGSVTRELLKKPDSLLHGVDFYAIDMNQGTKEHIQRDIELMGGECDEITYAYDTGTGNKEKMKEYWKAAGGDPDVLDIPMVVYIDADNRLQYAEVRNSRKTPLAADILANLKKYCNYPEYDIYRITYELDGGTNDSENPAIYTSETETITLKDPIKEGYTFEGWYTDAAFGEGSKVTEIAKGSAEDITLYAKWKEAPLEEGTYRITYELDGGTNNSANPRIYKAGAETITLKDASKTGYYFDGWYRDAEFKERVTKITGEDTGDITLYAKWVSTQGVNASNPEMSFPSLDGETFSTKAEGRPRLLIFYSTSAFYRAASRETIRNVKEVIDELDGVDIYAIDYNGTSRETVSKFKDDYGCDKITFACGEGDSSWYMKVYNAVGYYMIAANKSNGGESAAPYLCYIDADNVLRWITSGEKATGDEILTNLERYCGYRGLAEGTYRITYELDGGTNDGENPRTYTAETETIVLKDAAKTDYIFEGWYTDAAFDEGSRVTEITRGSSGDITLYAKWKKASLEEETYRITYVLDGGTNHSENPETYTAETETITLKDPVKEGYTFEGWYKDAAFGEGSKVTEITRGSTGDITLYAKWKEAPLEEGTYRITYELNGGTNDSSNPATYKEGTETITLKDAVREGYIFEGWYRDAEFKEQVTEITKEDKGDITLYAKWRKKEVSPGPNTPTGMTGITVRFTDNDGWNDTVPRYKYTGTAIKPAVKVYNNDTLLTLGTDYTLGYQKNTNVGKASLTVKGKGSFSGTSEAVSFDIVKADIDADTEHPVKMTVTAGSKVAPVIMNGTKKLTAKDYELKGDGLVKGKYANVTDGAPNELTVEGKGGYEGSFTIDVKVIDAKAAKKLTVTVDKRFKPVYGSSELAGGIDALFASPSQTDGRITVTDSKNKEKVLEKDTDFSVVCTSSMEEAGTVRFTVTGMGEYAGSVSKSFKISPLKVTDNAKFEVNFDSREYEYNAAGTTVDNLVVRYLGDTASALEGKTLTPSADYKVSYSNNKKVSTAKTTARVRITFLGNYKGSKAVSKNFTIVKAKMTAGIDANTAVVIPDKVYTKAGRAYKSAPIVTVDGAAIKSSNYTVKYEWRTESAERSGEDYIFDNNAVKITLGESDMYAKVKVTITPRGANYTADEGSVIEKEYYVRKAGSAKDISKAKVTFKDKDGKQLKTLEYNGKTFYTPEGNNPENGSAADDANAVYVSMTVGGEPVDASQYNVTWTNARAKGKATVVITGKGTLAVGSKKQTISIQAMKLKGKPINNYMEDMINNLKNIIFKLD